MRCFACNLLVTHEQLDTKTGRYYCNPCLEPTNRVQLTNLDESLDRLLHIKSDFHEVDDWLEDIECEEFNAKQDSIYYDGESFREDGVLD